jgi:hypothetical protein
MGWQWRVMLHDVEKGVLVLGCTEGTVYSPYHKTDVPPKSFVADIFAFLVRLFGDVHPAGFSVDRLRRCFVYRESATLRLSLATTTIPKVNISQLSPNFPFLILEKNRGH